MKNKSILCHFFVILVSILCHFFFIFVFIFVSFQLKVQFYLSYQFRAFFSFFVCHFSVILVWIDD